MSDVTRILSQIDSGDPAAAEQLLPLVYLVYNELRKLAHEKPGQTLQATALVHEAYVRLVGSSASGGREPPDGPACDQPFYQGADAPRSPAFHSRGRFFTAAAEAMRRILVESARRKARVKHGGEQQRVDLDFGCSLADEPSLDLLTLDEVLAKLAAVDRPRRSWSNSATSPD
ncbi:MAG TPA: ECF-type sigma factor [Pirellulaceae bacterium]|nr:ECF-type sigma factor [Pirellulaceae bacterium]